MEEQNQQVPQKSSKKKWLFIGFGTAFMGALTYFGWQYRKKKKAEKEEGDADVQEANAPASVPKPKVERNDNFPLKKGSRGENVKIVQQALLSKYGKSLLPKYGADGDFGSELESGLKQVGLPMSIDESTFNVLTKGSSPDAPATAKQFYDAAIATDFTKTIALLKTLRNTSDYKTVSTAFQNFRIQGVRQTLVNGLLNSFSDEKQKQAIRLAFSNMGLKYDGSKWSLSGFSKEKMLITKQRTKVWKDAKNFVSVPSNMVLGKALTKRGNFTLFKNDNKYYLVLNADVKEY